MKKHYFLSIVFLALITLIQAQSHTHSGTSQNSISQEEPIPSLELNPTIEPCGFQQVLKQLEQQYPGYNAHFDQSSQQKLSSKSPSNRKITITDTTYTYDTIFHIPVVFHILFSNNNENVHDSLILSQLEVLNRDFNRLNPDTTRTRNIFKPIVGSARIQFEFATTDPQGNATNGILRKATTVTQWGSFNGQLNDNMKFAASGGSNAWDPARYLNVWVCDMSYNNIDGILGYAYPPVNHPSWSSSLWVADNKQGVVIHYKVVGRNNPRATGALANSNKGRCAVHEVGHYLGLRHIWGDGSNCFATDFIDDTPKQASRSNFNCSFTANTCMDSPKDFPDMVENYMDYSSETCQNSFTKEQVLVMRNSILNFRKTISIRTDIITNARIFDTTYYDKIIVYTNPNSRNIIVELPNDFAKNKVEISLYNAIGQKVGNTTPLSLNETHIPTNNFSPGVYVAVLSSTDTHQPLRKIKILLP